MLTDEHITQIYNRYGGEMVNCARAIERNAKAQDTALIQQMLEVLDDGDEHTARCAAFYWPKECDCNKQATLAAARARLAETGAQNIGNSDVPEPLQVAPQLLGLGTLYWSSKPQNAADHQSVLAPPLPAVGPKD